MFIVLNSLIISRHFYSSDVIQWGLPLIIQQSEFIIHTNILQQTKIWSNL